MHLSFFVRILGPPRSTHYPCTTLLRPPSVELDRPVVNVVGRDDGSRNYEFNVAAPAGESAGAGKAPGPRIGALRLHEGKDRKSTRLNSSHANISYAVFCLKTNTG